MDEVSTVNPATQEIPDCFYYIDLESVSAGVLSNPKVIRNTEAPSRAQRVVKTGDVLFQTVRPYQQNNYIVSDEFDLPVVASTGYAQIRTTNNSRFLYSLFHTAGFLNEVLLRCAGSNYPAINSNDLKEISIHLPERKEQDKIASFMSLLDKKIAKQRQLVEAIETYKKGALSKLFPQNGETTPEYRFAGFTGAWEQRKLGSLLKTISLKPFLKEPGSSGEYEVIQQGNEPVAGYANGEPYRDYQDAVVFGDHTLSLYKPQSPFFVATDGVRILKGSKKTDGNYLLALLENYKPQSEGYKRYYSIPL